MISMMFILIHLFIPTICYSTCILFILHYSSFHSVFWYFSIIHWYLLLFSVIVLIVHCSDTVPFAMMFFIVVIHLFYLLMNFGDIHSFCCWFCCYCLFPVIHSILRVIRSFCDTMLLMITFVHGICSIHDLHWAIIRYHSDTDIYIHSILRCSPHSVTFTHILPPRYRYHSTDDRRYSTHRPIVCPPTISLHSSLMPLHWCSFSTFVHSFTTSGPYILRPLRRLFVVVFLLFIWNFSTFVVWCHHVVLYRCHSSIWRYYRYRSFFTGVLMRLPFSLIRCWLQCSFSHSCCSLYSHWSPFGIPGIPLHWCFLFICCCSFAFIRFTFTMRWWYWYSTPTFDTICCDDFYDLEVMPFCWSSLPVTFIRYLPFVTTTIPPFRVTITLIPVPIRRPWYSWCSVIHSFTGSLPSVTIYWWYLLLHYSTILIPIPFIPTFTSPIWPLRPFDVVVVDDVHLIRWYIPGDITFPFISSWLQNFDAFVVFDAFPTFWYHSYTDTLFYDTGVPVVVHSIWFHSDTLIPVVFIHSMLLLFGDDHIRCSFDDTLPTFTLIDHHIVLITTFCHFDIHIPDTILHSPVILRCSMLLRLPFLRLYSTITFVLHSWCPDDHYILLFSHSLIVVFHSYWPIYLFDYDTICCRWFHSYSFTTFDVTFIRLISHSLLLGIPFLYSFILLMTILLSHIQEVFFFIDIPVVLMLLLLVFWYILLTYWSHLLHSRYWCCCWCVVDVLIYISFHDIVHCWWWWPYLFPVDTIHSIRCCSSSVLR